jgi:hypothetical protein
MTISVTAPQGTSTSPSFAKQLTKFTIWDWITSQFVNIFDPVFGRPNRFGQPTQGSNYVGCTNLSAAGQVGGATGIILEYQLSPNKPAPFYFEVTLSLLGTGNTIGGGIGVAQIDGNFEALSVSAIGGVMMQLNGDYWAGGLLVQTDSFNTALIPTNAIQQDDTIGVAVQFWPDNSHGLNFVSFYLIRNQVFLAQIGRNMDGSGSGAGPLFPNVGFVPFVCFADAAAIGIDSYTANFGAAPFQMQPADMQSNFPLGVSNWPGGG